MIVAVTDNQRVTRHPSRNIQNGNYSFKLFSRICYKIRLNYFTILIIVKEFEIILKYKKKKKNCTSEQWLGISKNNCFIMLGLWYIYCKLKRK